MFIKELLTKDIQVEYVCTNFLFDLIWLRLHRDPRNVRELHGAHGPSGSSRRKLKLQVTSCGRPRGSSGFSPIGSWSCRLFFESENLRARVKFRLGLSLWLHSRNLPRGVTCGVAPPFRCLQCAACPVVWHLVCYKVAKKYRRKLGCDESDGMIQSISLASAVVRRIRRRP